MKRDISLFACALLSVFLIQLVGGRSFAQTNPALVLDGLNDYAVVPDNDSLDLGAGATQSFTIEAFFDFPDTNSFRYASLLFKDQAYELAIEFPTNVPLMPRIYFNVWQTTNFNGRSQFLTFLDLKPGKHHLAAILWNTTTQDLRVICLDGRRIAFSQSPTFTNGIVASLAPLSVGGAHGSNTFRGWLQEVRLSNIARYTNYALYSDIVPYRVPTNSFVADANTVALWHFTEAAGSTTFLDASGRGNHLTGMNGVSTGPAPPPDTRPGALDLAFYPGLGAYADTYPNGIQTLARLTNGQILVGGPFTSVDGLARTNLARLNADGSLDTSFDAKLWVQYLPGNVSSLIVLSNGQILIGGEFNSVNGANWASLARLNANGSLDASFGPVFTSGNNWITSMILQPDGRILISGNFVQWPGATRHFLARLNASGTLDTSFDPGANIFGRLHKLLLQPDGRVLCLGSLGLSPSFIHTNLVRLNPNGTLDTSFPQTITTGGGIDDMALQKDGRIVVAGLFDTINGVVRNGAARLITNGTVDLSFDLANSQPYFYTNGGWLDFVAIQADGRILLHGFFETAPYTGFDQLVRFESNGAWDPGLEPVSFVMANNRIYTSAFITGGEILIGGEFIDVNGYSRCGIARVYGDPIPSPRFVSIVRQFAGQMYLIVTNPALSPITLQATTNLVSAGWTNLAAHLSSTNRLQFTDTNAPAFRHRFYRALVEEP